jgi:hypothetical protein
MTIKPLLVTTTAITVYYRDAIGLALGARRAQGVPISQQWKLSLNTVLIYNKTRPSLTCYFTLFLLSCPELPAAKRKLLSCYKNSVVGVATGYGMDDRGGRRSSLGTVKNFLFSTTSIPALRLTQPPSQWVPGGLTPGLKRPGREADHSPPTSADVKKMWTSISTSPYAFMA